MKSILFVVVFGMILSGCATQPPANILSLSPYTQSKGTYIVKPKETIYSIARDQNISFQQLARINNIVPPYIIYAGQKLLLRAKANQQPKNLASSVAKERAQLVANASTKPAAIAPQPISSSSKNLPNKQYSPAQPSLAANKAKHVEQVKPSATLAPISAKPQLSPITKDDNNKLAAVQEVVNAKKKINWIWPVRGPILSRFSKGVARKNGINIAGKEGTSIKAVAPGKVVYSGSGLRGYGHMIIIKHANNFLSAYAHNKKNLVQEGNFVKIGQQIAEMGNTGSNKVMLHFEVRHNGVPIDPEKVLPKIN